MDTTYFLISTTFVLLLLQHIGLFVMYMMALKHKRNVEQNFAQLFETVELNQKDFAEVISKLMVYLEKEFQQNYDNQKKMVDWLEKNMESVTINSNKSLTGIDQTQKFLGRMSEALGIVNRSNLQDI
jgi:hypothetical protein